MKLIVLLCAALGTLYRVVLTLLQYRAANNPTPEAVADVYDAETYQKWKRYSAENSKVSLTFVLISLCISLTLLATNAYSAFAALFPAGPFWQLFAVLLLEAAVDVVVLTVQNYIFTMVIEEKYGFNRSTMKTFVIDRIRSTILSFALSLGLVTLLWCLHSLTGDFMILLFAGAMFLFSIVVSFLYPLFSRIGNKFTPLEEGELKDSLMELLTKHGYKVKAIEVMDASRRTTKLNAYFTGFGQMKTIVLYDNLVNAMTPDEICAVFAHELGHGLHRDVLKMQILNFGNLLLMALVVWGAVKLEVLHTLFGFETVNYGFAVTLLGIGLGLVQPLTGLISNAYSRRAEYRADRQAVMEGYGPAMITALKKLARENFSHLAPSRLNVLLEYSHPPLNRRVEEVTKLMESADPKDTPNS